MFKEVGHPVLFLERTGYAFLEIKGLEQGSYRLLTPQEVEQLKTLVGL